jgi:hypothetical protein
MLTMKSVQTAAPGTVEVTEIERPVPGPLDPDGQATAYLLVENAVAGRSVAVFPDTLPFEVAALNEPMAVARHCVNRSAGRRFRGNARGGALAPGRGCGGVRSSTARSGRMTAPSRYGRMLVLFLGAGSGARPGAVEPGRPDALALEGFGWPGGDFGGPGQDLGEQLQ